MWFCFTKNFIIMYVKNNVVYADAGNILISKTAIGYSLIANIANIQEQ